MDRIERSHNLVTMCLLAVAVGIVAAIGAWIFKKLIALFHNALLLQQFGWSYEVTDYVSANPWGWGIILGIISISAERLKGAPCLASRVVS